MWLRILWHLYRLRKNQWLEFSELQKIQQRKLRAVIRHAYENISFYRRRFRAVGLVPSDIKTVEDLTKVPMITRSDIKEGLRTGEILDKDVNLSNCHLAKTAGSTGEPLTVVYDAQAEDFQKAVGVRSFLEAGVRFRDRWAMITSPQRMMAEKKWFQYFGFLSPTYLSVFDSPDRHISVLKDLEPDVIGGYSSCVWLLAKTVRAERIVQIQPRVILGTAEVLSERAREFINSTFDLEMFNQLGCVEVGRSAWECDEHNGYHMDIDALAMEFVDHDNQHVAPGEKGRLLYTSLYNYAMPLIRYDVGDICVTTDEQCSCGRGLPLLKGIEGRVFDLIETPDGQFFSGGSLMITMREILGIAQYRVVQETRDKFLVQIVKDDNSFTSETPFQVKEKIREYLGDVTVKVEVMEKIPKDKSGKHHWIVSKARVD